MARILLVEDHPDTRYIYRMIFDANGHEVIEATNGEVGLRRALDERPDLVVLDLGLPVMDGWTVLRRLREEPAGRDINVLVVTAHGDHARTDESIRTTCDGLLVKPISPRRLLAAAEECIRGRRQESASGG